MRKGFYLLLAIHMLMGCSEDGLDRNIDPVEVQMEMHRLDAQILAADSPESAHTELLDKHPDFYPIYFQDVLQLGDIRSPSASEQLALFMEDPIMNDLSMAVDSLGASMESQIRSDMEDGLGRYAAMFPEASVPDVYLMNSGFNFGIYPIDDVLGIGGEFYLGTDHPMLQGLPPDLFPQYVRNKMIPAHLVPNALRGLLLVRLQDQVPAVTLIDHMVFYGKVMYILELMLPGAEEHYQYSFSEDELFWCQENEAAIWRALVKDELLYKKDRMTLGKWLDRAPFTQGFPEESPGQLGIYMGKEMVKDYMRANPAVDIQTLVFSPSEPILDAYRP
jgi:hypothetical protein